MSTVFQKAVAAWLTLGMLSGCSWMQRQMEEKEVPLGYRGEARVKPFLAATRFLEAMGLDVEECFSLTKLPEPDVALLLPAEGDRTGSSAQRLLQWAGEGGHVIYLLRGGDSFINDFAGEATWDDEKEEKPAAEKSPPAPVAPASQDAPPKTTGREKSAPPVGDKAPKPKPDASPPPSSVPPPDATPARPAQNGKSGPGRLKKHSYPFLNALSAEVVEREKGVDFLQIDRKRWRVEIPPGQGFSVPKDVAGIVEVHAAGPRGRRAFLSFPRGEGRITLLADAKLWRNRHIGEKDHAELLWEVARLGPSTRAVWVVRSTRVSLFELIWQHGRRPLIGLGLFLAVWLWWATRRFGPRLPDPEGASRDFTHHIAMSGHFLWRQRAIPALVDPVRRRIRARHGLREDGHREGWEEESLARLARQSGLDEPSVARALWGAPPGEARHLAELIRHLQILDTI